MSKGSDDVGKRIGGLIFLALFGVGYCVDRAGVDERIEPMVVVRKDLQRGWSECYGLVVSPYGQDEKLCTDPGRYRATTIGSTIYVKFQRGRLTNFIYGEAVTPDRLEH